MADKNGINGPTQDPSTGRFVKGGAGGPGRKPGIKVSFRNAARKRAAELDIDLDKEVGTLAMLLLKQAKEGDVQAAKFVVERLCGLLKQELDVQATSTVYMPDDARAVLGRMMGTDVAQDALLDECERRTDGA